MKKLLLLLGIILGCINCFADEVTTTFSATSYSYVESSVQNAKARLYRVTLTDFFTYVTIELTPTKNSQRLTYWTSDNTYVESGNAKLPLLGAKGTDNTYHSCTYDDGWGWNDVKAGERYYYTLIFSGRIPEGQTNFTLKDYASSGRGFGFSNYTINNPKNHSVRDELYCKANADQNNDGICGIYEEIGGSKYRLACIKEDGQYYLVYLGCADRISWWFAGDLKARLEESATLGLFKAIWVMKNKTKEDEAYVTFDGSVMKSFLPNGSPTESTYLKMYPSASSGNGGGSRIHTPQEPEWSGTGFALTGNYIATNYHVIEEAKSIWVQGVNGDFNTKHTASVVATDKFNDLAILQVKGVNITTSSIPYSVKTTTSDVGEDVFVLGYPLTSTMGEEIKLTTGVVSSKTGFQGDVSLYQISAPVQPGNSGGPLFDSNGNVIGIVSSKHKEAENVGYAIKASYLRNLMESALSENILPQTNRIANYKLSDKVKYLKNYVYYITCSSSGSSSFYNGNSNYTGGTVSGNGSGETFRNAPWVAAKDNKIYYTTSDGKKLSTSDIKSDAFGTVLVSNIYEYGQGVLTFDDTITSIGDEAFCYCTSLTSITIPDGVTSIGSAAFSYCTSLTSVTIPNSVISIGNRAFLGCTSLTSITIPDGVTSIGSAAFSGCSSLTSITIPDSVTSIGKYAFNNCKSLASISIPDGVTSIGYEAFYDCSSLTSITIPDSVTWIGDSAFYDCSSLTSITIPDSVTRIGMYAFYGCTGELIINSKIVETDYSYDNYPSYNGWLKGAKFSKLTIGNGITSIGEYAFSNCSSLTSITIPDSVTSIGYWAFTGCSSLIGVYCKPTTPPKAGGYMFTFTGYKIYVPRTKVQAYKAAYGWSDYADHIVGYDF